MPFAATLLKADETRWTDSGFVTHVKIGVYDATDWATDGSGNPIPPSPLPDPFTEVEFDVAGAPDDAAIATQAIAAAQEGILKVEAPVRFAQRMEAWRGRFLAVPEPS